jgi:hypothetical protein
MPAPNNPPPTRILSWLQYVREADPGYTRLSLQPWTLEFSNGRLFVDPLPLYGDTIDWFDSSGGQMLDDAGNTMQNP